MSNRIPLFIIAGPTAAGKSRLALHLAQKWETGIISADSRQIYRYMDIGTGKPTREEQGIAPHYMLDLIDPDESYSAGEFARTARPVIDWMIKKGQIPIIAGGTGLYIRALINGLAPSPPSNPLIKADLIKQLEENGIKPLYQRLRQIDPPIAGRLHPNDRQRILRALEVFYTTGKRLSDLQTATPDSQDYSSIFLFINRPRSVLYSMIEKRIDTMFEQGLIQEAELLLKKGYNTDHPGIQSLGYRHLFDYLHGRISLADAKRLIARDTRRYAKRQITWFRREKRAICIECPEQMDVLNLVSKIDSLMLTHTF